MEFVADLHLHGKYSRAVSKDIVLEQCFDGEYGKVKIWPMEF